MTPHELPATRDRLSPSGAFDVHSSECEVVLASLWDYLDGRCSPDVAGQIVSHVPACSPCSRYLLIQEQFFASLAAVRQRATAPAGLRKRVRKAVAGERQALSEE